MAGEEASSTYPQQRTVSRLTKRVYFMAIPVYKTETGSSRTQKKIRLKPQDSIAAEQISKEMGVNPVLGRVLAARGFRPDETLKQFINPSLREGLPNPSQLKNLKEAAALIGEVHKAGKAIAICCDFDVDGLSGGSLVHDLFNTAKIASKVFVPDRFVDGYGLNEKVVRQIAHDGFGLLLTIDFGTTNAKEFTIARELGLKTIVVDHHHMTTEAPPVDVFINPNQPGCGFASGTACAAGLAWYLTVGLKSELKLNSVDSRDLLELACLGTICDMVPLVGMNRVIAKRGLERLSITERPGLRALRNVMGVRGAVGCTDVSFGIGPRLNAAGRIVHGELVVELLTTRDTSRAEKLARQLNDLNAERQDIEGSVKAEAIQQVERDVHHRWGLAAYGQDFHTGVIGIVAQRVVEHFYRPAAVMGMDTDGIYKGSVRGIKGFSVIEALSELSTYLIKFGGHTGAGGFSIKESDLPHFKSAWNDVCERRLKEIEIEPYIDADTEAELSEISVPLVAELKNLAPFGIGNPNPHVLVRNLRVVEVRDIKGAHLKVLLSDGRRFVSGIMWRQTSHPALKPNNFVDIVFRPEVSTYGGTTELQANLQAIEVSSESR
jgi:single-stranded-DNA-specific exonuclease